ncbi:MAG: glycosyltransferase [Propionibacteriaceae bacterium]|nr:glycosyltransferase [Propionibacteriaceae bacterium]
MSAVPSTPRVVLFRHAPIDIDSRVKKFATTLQRAGYEPVVISLEPVGGIAGEYRLGGDIRVIRLPIVRAPREKADTTRVNNLEARRTMHRRRAVYRDRITGANTASAKALLKWATSTAKVVYLKTEDAVSDVTFRLQQARDKRRGEKDPFVLAGVDRGLPVVTDIANTLTDLLVDLRPDVLHAHHPQVLLAARDALRILREQGHAVKFYYDARENFAGIPDMEQGLRAAHEALIACEAAMIGEADAVSTVSEPIADVLRENYALAARPSVFLNMPPLTPLAGPTTVREAAGLGPDVPVVLYSGTMSWARGIETIVRGIAHMPPEAHLVIVSVPLPHPMIPKLEALAAEHGLADRLHFVGPVSQDQLLHYLSGADVAVHPLPGGSPNHDAAMPNKLFEYLHAGLPLVVSDAKLMAAFVSDNGVGRVFTSEDPVSFGEQVGATLADLPSERVHEVAATYSWQGQEGAIISLYNSLTGFDGHLPAEEVPFGSLEVTPAVPAH